MADLSERLAALDDEQRRVLLDRLRDRGTPRNREAGREATATPRRSLGMSIFFFSADSTASGRDPYHLVVEAAKRADELGFEAVWVPERHFDAFGGPYPSPAILAASLARQTSNIAIRAGSVVLPLQQPIRVAEEWSVIDNLSGGRVGVSFASGWHPNDFVLAPDAWAERRDVMFEGIETIRTLWAGDSVRALNGAGVEVDVRIHPRPIQQRLPIWITSAKSEGTWLRAAEIGANVLTALLEQSVEELAEKIALYRRSLAEHGHDPSSPRVTAMLHAFVGTDLDRVRAVVRPPMLAYMRAHIGMYEQALKTERPDLDLDSFTEADREALVEHAFERYFNTSALFGDLATASRMVRNLVSAGVDEIAGLIDFGAPDELVIDQLEHMGALRDQFAETVGKTSPPA